MHKYDVVHLCDFGDGVDSAHYTGVQVSLEYPTLENAIDALREIGYLTEDANTLTVSRYEDEIGAFDGRSITLRDVGKGLFLYELRPR